MTEMEPTVRAFVALTLPTDVREYAGRLQGTLKERGLELRWVKPQNLHLTLKFLGEIPRVDVAKIGAAMHAATKNETPLALNLQGMGVFPSIKRPRVLWIGFGGQVTELKQLHHGLQDQLEPMGYERDNRGFNAHLTIARIKERITPARLLAAIEASGNFEPLPFVARKLILYQSDLRPTGALYTPLEAATLGSRFP